MHSLILVDSYFLKLGNSNFSEKTYYKIKT